MTQPVPPEQSSIYSSTIDHWLNGLPEDLNGREDALLPQHHTFRKRARASETAEPCRSKRLQLASISGNAIAPKSPVKTPATPQSSSRKKQSQEQAQLPAADLGNPYDPEQTPPPGLLTNVPNLNHVSNLDPSSPVSNIPPPLHHHLVAGRVARSRARYRQDHLATLLPTNKCNDSSDRTSYQL